MFETVGSFEGYSSFDVLFAPPQNQPRTYPDIQSFTSQHHYTQNQLPDDSYIQEIEERLNRITREKAILQRQLSDIQYNVETRRTGFPYMWGSNNPPWLISVTGDFSCSHTRCAFRTRNPQFLAEHKASGRHFHLDAIFFASSRPVSEERDLDETEAEQAGEGQSSSVYSNGPAMELPLRSVFRQGDGQTQNDFAWPDSMTSSSTAPQTSNSNHNIKGQTETDFPWPAEMNSPSIPSHTSSPNHHTRSPLQYIGDVEEPIPTNNSSPPSTSHPHQPKETRQFRCTRCPKRFTRSATLREHIRTHTNDRPFECSVCLKQFARLKDRNRHQALHTAQPPEQVGATRNTSKDP